MPAKIEGELLEAQAVAPVQEIAAFFQDVIGNIQSVLIIFAIQVVIVAGVGMMVSGRLKGQPIPFGPFLAMAGLIALFWGKEIVSLYLDML